MPPLVRGRRHGRTEIADAAGAQMRELAAFDTFDRLANRPALELADRVGARAVPDAAVFFGSGGSDAVDTAASSPAATGTRSGSPTSGSSSTASTATTA